MNEQIPVAPSLAICPSLRATLAAAFREVEEMPFPLACAEIVATARRHRSALEYGGQTDLSVLLEAPP